MSGMNVGRIDPSTRIFKMPEEIPGAQPKAQPQGEDKTSFGQLVKGVLEEAVQTDRAATAAISDFAAGNTQDVHNVIVAANRANLALGLLVQIRNRLVTAYNELSKISM